MILAGVTKIEQLVRRSRARGGARRLVKLGAVVLAVLLLVGCSAPIEGGGGSAPAQPGRTASPEPTIRVKVGVPIVFSDGLRLTVLSIEDQAPGTGFLASTPSPGLRYVAVFVRIENGSPQTVEIEGFHFKLSDGRSVRRDRVNFSGVPRSDEFKSGNVAPGSALAGSLIFEAPAEDPKLELVFEKVGYRIATIELY